MNQEQWIEIIAWGVGVLGIPGLLKILAPKTFDAIVAKFRYNADEQAKEREFNRDQADAKAAAEAQEEVALWSAMVRLQTQTISQNEKLLDFIIQHLSGQLAGLADDFRRFQEEMRLIQREMTEIKADNRLSSTEVIRVLDSFEKLEKRLMYIVTCIPEVRGYDLVDEKDEKLTGT